MENENGNNKITISGEINEICVYLLNEGKFFNHTNAQCELISDIQ